MYVRQSCRRITDGMGSCEAGFKGWRAPAHWVCEAAYATVSLGSVPGLQTRWQDQLSQLSQTMQCLCSDLS